MLKDVIMSYLTSYAQKAFKKSIIWVNYKYYSQRIDPKNYNSKVQTRTQFSPFTTHFCGHKRFGDFSLHSFMPKK